MTVISPRIEFDAVCSVSPILRAIPELNFSAFWIPQMATSFGFPSRVSLHENAQCTYCFAISVRPSNAGIVMSKRLYVSSNFSSHGLVETPLWFFFHTCEILTGWACVGPVDLEKKRKQPTGEEKPVPVLSMLASCIICKRLENCAS